MYLHHISLTHFRNYTRLELDFPGALTLIQGCNAQGKSNLLEAIVMLATSRSPLAMADKEMVNWLSLDERLPFARLVAVLERHGRRQKIEMTLLAQEGPRQNGAGFRKQIQINGAPKRAMDLVGLLPVVLFMPQDTELVSGAPSVRRHYLDVALCQMDAVYCRSLSQYNRILMQRNALLRQLREVGRASDELALWDERLVKAGSVVLARRQKYIAALDREANQRHQALTDGKERLHLHYLPGLNADDNGGAVNGAGATPPLSEHVADVAAEFHRRLQRERGRELAAGASLFGPHRDEVGFRVGGRDLRLFGSRGQQRTGALAVKLAEVAVMTHEIGEPPLLLLDDVMSELDATRRAALLDGLAGVSQAICTTTDWEDFTPEFRQRAACYQVQMGRIQPAQDAVAGEDSVGASR